MMTDEPQTLSLKIKGIKEVTAGDIVGARSGSNFKSRTYSRSYY
jgi:hypothetical protein